MSKIEIENILIWPILKTSKVEMANVRRRSNLKISKMVIEDNSKCLKCVFGMKQPMSKPIMTGTYQLKSQLDCT